MYNIIPGGVIWQPWANLWPVAKYVKIDLKNFIGLANSRNNCAHNSKILAFQIYKATGDIDSARKMYDHYSGLNSNDPTKPWLKWREIVMARKRPRKMFVQANTVENGEIY